MNNPGQLPDPSSFHSIGWVLVALASIMVIARTCIGLWRDLTSGGKSEITNKPLLVQMQEEFARDEDCKARHSREGLAIEELRKQFIALRTERLHDTEMASQGRKEIYNQIDKVRTELSDKVDSMPAEIVTQLLNSKQLWK